MNRTELELLVKRLFCEASENHVVMEGREGVSGALQMFEEPLIGIGAADDALFEDYKSPEAVGPWHRSPKEWLPGAKTVISLFFPISGQAKESNGRERENPSLEWLYCRIEGNEFLRTFIGRLRDCLTGAGYPSCAPALDGQFQAFMNQKADSSGKPVYGSRWSERHVAYLCGLGTFGLSKGIITRKGMAGRFCSLVTELELTPDIRPYEGLYDYCIQCGKCIERCPVQAISAEKGKEHLPCHRWLMHTKEVYAPRLGCGKCQTAVPCESRIPLEKKAMDNIGERRYI